MTCLTHTDQNFATLGSTSRIWAIPAIHAAIDKLYHLHNALFEVFTEGDKIVYMGNYTGYGQNAVATIDEILAFRRGILARPGVQCSDFVYLRGGQEEMLQKLLQLAFAPNPSDVFLWMIGNGLQETLNDYGVCVHDGVNACREGVISLTRWIADVRRRLHSCPGHETFSMQLKRAAMTDPGLPSSCLFVHAGLNPLIALEQQGDNFWWGSDDFALVDKPYHGFEKIIRGYDMRHKGQFISNHAVTLDNGCGFDGSLFAAGFDKRGEIFHTIEI